ncbi:serine hydrolase domain-containing protein [Nocardia suismassiliense]|uniref:Serine hydrolase domain-containing protein n=1 Tax=Nocardia suismassiliense TaxID=2077092 RepID=A0ABW6R1V2_9NOCA
MSDTRPIPPVPPTPSVQVTKGDWQKMGFWSFQHVDKLLRTVNIPRNHGKEAELKWAQSVDRNEILHKIDVQLADNDRWTVRQIIDATDTDGWMVLHDGEVVVEEYPRMSAGTRHLLMSVSKSLTATVAGTLVDDKTINPDLEVTHYVPDLKSSGYVGATVRQVLDMVSDVEFSEDYFDTNSGVREMEAACDWTPLPRPDAPKTLKEFLRGVTAQGLGHGGRFEYRSCETNVLGWVCEAAYTMRYNTDKPFADLASELLWSKLGAEFDAYIPVDSEGTATFDAGFCVTLRDLARFGAMICRNGKSLRDDQQVVSQEWVDDIFTGGDDSEKAFKRGPKYDQLKMPKGKYRSMFWSPTRDRNVVVCIGIHGQMIYINRATQTVGVKLSSWALAEEEWKGAWKGFSALWMFDAISKHLDKSASRTPAGAASR